MTDRPRLDGRRRAPSWPAVVTVAISSAVALAALVTVAELDIGPADAADPSVEWFTLARERALLAGLVIASSGCAVLAGWSDLDRRRARASGITVGAALLTAGWAALPVALWSGEPSVRAAAFVAAALIPVALAHLGHSALLDSVDAPFTRAVTEATPRAAWAGAYLLVIAVAVVHVLSRDPFLDPRCMVHCEPLGTPLDSEGLTQATDVALRSAATAAGALAGVIGAVVLARAGSVTARLAGLAAALAGAAELAWALAPRAVAVLGPLPFEREDLLAARLLTQTAAAATVIALLVVQGRHRSRLRRMAREVVAVTPPSGVREILALRLDDPGAQIEYAVEDEGLWVDEQGQLAVGGGGPARQVAVVSREDRTIARVRLTTGEVRAADLEDALGPAAVLALEAEQAQAELLMRLRALQDLRRHVVEESDEARRRAERDLHDGAQHLLLAATFAIQEALRDARERADTGAAGALDHALADVAGSAADLRAVAHGMYPVLLGDAGLVPALEGLALSSPTATTLDADPVGRVHPSVELTVYQACALAARGADEHGSLAISLRRRGDDLRLGLTSAHLPHPALDPLGDRVAALGGTMVTMAGSVVVEMPCV